MVRRPRLAVSVSPHPDIQRGHNRHVFCFTEDDDYASVAAQRQVTSTYQCRIAADVLMTPKELPREGRLSGGG
jgi:hypothetical protein